MMGAHFEIKVDGVVRSHRDDRNTAIKAARFLQQRHPGAKVAVSDLRDGSVVAFVRDARHRPPPGQRARLAPQVAAAAARHAEAQNVQWWIKCTRCPHTAAVAIVPYIIRWGPDGWQDMLRQTARCTECGKRGVALQHLSWGGADTGWAPMPIDKMAPVPRLDEHPA